MGYSDERRRVRYQRIIARIAKEPLPYEQALAWLQVEQGMTRQTARENLRALMALGRIALEGGVLKVPAEVGANVK